MTYEIHEGDVLKTLRRMRSDSFDACLSDPPYGLGFMGKAWDHGVPSAAVWSELLRVLKPGAPMMAFGATRMFHRLFVAIEDGGFELRDTIAWIYGQGYPKSLDLSKAIDKDAGAVREVVGTKLGQPGYSLAPSKGGGFLGAVGGTGDPAREVEITAPSTDLARTFDGQGTALKPSWEPVCFATKPLDGTYVENVRRWGVGGLAIDASRIDRAKTPAPTARGDSAPWFTGASGDNLGGDDTKGGWPGNVMLDGEAGEALDAMTGTLKSGAWNGEMTGGARDVSSLAMKSRPYGREADEGGASRFFYCPKVSRFEREFGCEALPMRTVVEAVGRKAGSKGAGNARAGASRKDGARNHHPTLKPIDLARYLARMMLPPPRDGQPRRILVPLLGRRQRDDRRATGRVGARRGHRFRSRVHHDRESSARSMGDGARRLRARGHRAREGRPSAGVDLRRPRAGGHVIRPITITFQGRDVEILAAHFDVTPETLTDAQIRRFTEAALESALQDAAGEEDEG